MKILLAVDGSESALRATRKLVAMLSQWKDAPPVEVVSVHPPVPHAGVFASAVISHDMVQRYYKEEGEQALAACVKVLQDAGVAHVPHVLVGDVAPTIVRHAHETGCELICLGTRGMTAISNLVIGSVATKVLHLADVPVLLVH